MTLLRGPVPSLLPALIACALGAALAAQGPTWRRIEPGPPVISEEEKRIDAASDPEGRGAVILLEETEQDDSEPYYPKRAYHLRAKVLSNEGRDLANIEIPYRTKDAYLHRWWARTILPDGSVLELEGGDLKEQVLAQGGGLKVRVKRAALRGVVPGCVIDYGDAIRGEGSMPVVLLPLHREWPLRKLLHRWLPSRFGVGDCRLRNADGLQVKVSRERGAVTVAAHDLPPLQEEPWMPAGARAKPFVLCHYARPGGRQDVAGDGRAKRLEAAARRFAEEGGAGNAVSAAVASMPFPAEAGLEEKLRIAYDWIAVNVPRRPPSRVVVVGLEDLLMRMKAAPRGADAVLSKGGASDEELDYLSLAFARALGAEARVVLAARWEASAEEEDPEGALLAGPAEETVVQIRAPGGPDDSWVSVDAGSGLPYGQIPWYLGRQRGRAAGETGDQEVVLPSSRAGDNVRESRATISLDESGTGAAVVWTLAGRGQVELVERRVATSLPDEDRRRRLKELCGDGGSLEITRAEAPDLEKPASGFRIACEGRMEDAWAGPEYPGVSLSFDGAWIEPVPDLAAPERKYPVVFPYPKVELATVEVMAPSGYAPSEAPPALRIETSFARLNLEIAVTDLGYRVKRDFALLKSVIAPEEYPALRSFLAEVRRGDRTKLEFTRGGPEDP
jgi:hypothetical protein